MMTVRRFLSAQYDWTGLSSRILRSRAWYLGSLVSVALLVLLSLVAYHLAYAGMPPGDLARTPMGLEHMFPTATYFTLGVIVLPLLLLLSQAARMWVLVMRRGGGAHIPFAVYLAEAGTYFGQSVSQRLLRKCPEKGRWVPHWFLVLGTVIMLAVLAFALRWFQTDSLYPLYHPQRWLGYFATVFMVFGAGDILRCHLLGQKEICKTATLEDLMFPFLLLFTALSGIAVHILRYAGYGLACHFTFALHIMIVTPMLVVEIPFGKWSHMIYRPLALYFRAVRERAQHGAGKEALGDAA